MLLLPDALLDARRTVATRSLALLADSLAADLVPALARGVDVPTEKAVLSRVGGRCKDDGTPLAFDPFSPDAHRCPRCDRIHTGEWHHHAWLYPFQLWLAERAVHGALLYLLRGDARHRAFAAGLLERYAEQYLHYPNRDNVLGPSRVFFSTYLESIWLLQICIASDLLQRAGDDATPALVRDRIIEPAAAIIAQFDEGLSNRQCWNNAALMAAALLTGRRADAERIIRAPSGLHAHLSNGLLPDGTWYEGDNYHQFAHRGLWYCITMAESAGLAVDAPLVRRFNSGFATPFLTALPDFTFPARKDSQYGVSLRQWRYAELCELGLARHDDARLVGALHAMYESNDPPGDTGRARSAADVEHHTTPVRLTRADLGWRALLHARASLPRLAPCTPTSAHLVHQGYTVFRRDDGAVHVALDWGQSGGGHGHPDRLNLTFSHGDSRWLDDLGTGSYVDPSLHWYRSTLAHNAPLASGRSQERVSGRLLAHDERGGVGWILAEATVAPGVRVQRALVVTPDYFVDEVLWEADAPTQFDLPVHFDGTPEGLTFREASLDGGSGLEDGFSHLTETASASVPARREVALRAKGSGREARCWIAADADATWYRASGPGQPAAYRRNFHVLRCNGQRGAIRSVWTWSPRVDSVQIDEATVRVAMGGERHEHRRTPEYWEMQLFTGAAQSGIELFGWEPSASIAKAAPQVASRLSSAPPQLLARGGEPLTFQLSEEHYRRSEESWIEAGCPRATITVSASMRELTVQLEAGASPFKHGPRSSENPFDNEPVDINYPGIQLYVATPDDGGAWVVRPGMTSRDGESRRLAGWGQLALTAARSSATPYRYTLWAVVALPASAAHGDYPIWLDVLVNDAPFGRNRRRGQLVLSGAHGEFVYLRGDRHDPRRLIPFLITDRAPKA